MQRPCDPHGKGRRGTRAHKATAPATPPAQTSADDVGSRSLPPAWRRLLHGKPERGTQRSRRSSGSALGFFFELINHAQAPAAALEVAPVLLGKADKGSAGRATALDDPHLAQASLSTADQRLVRCVLGLPHTRRKGRIYATLSGDIGDALLNEMLDTAPCFIGGVAGLRLARGKRVTPNWSWRLHDDGGQRLLPELAAGHTMIRVGALWSLDAQNALLCQLHGTAAEAALLDAPMLAPGDSAAMAAALPGSWLATRIPPPRVFDTIRSIDQPPQAVLTLHATRQHAPGGHAATDDAGTPQDNGKHHLAYARLGFDYAGVHIANCSGAAVQRHVGADGALLEIQRHRAEELAIMDRLEGTGLRPAVDTEGLPWDIAGALPDDAWLFPGAGHDGALDVNTSTRWLALRRRLVHEGFALEWATSFPVEVLEGESRWYADVRSDDAHDAFDLDIGIELDGERINLLPALDHALDQGEFSLDEDDRDAAGALWYAPVDARRRVPLRLHDVRGILAPLRDVLRSITASGTLHLPRVQAGRLEELGRALPDPGTLDAPADLRQFTRRLRQAARHTDDAAAPPALVATLRDYQRDGLTWLNALAQAGVGGVLADDMGLGKTLQLLAHVHSLKDAGSLQAPALVVAPTSVLPNWQSETARFAPGLRQLTLHGPQRAEQFDAIDTHDLILTSYALLPRDLDSLLQHRFTLIAADEAQQVKNPQTQARKALRALHAPRRICLTGTPLENHLGELWSQLDLAVPGLLGDEAGFRRHYRTPIEKHGDEHAQQRLNRRIAPFILRRTKAEVAVELPPKTEITRRVTLEGRQRALYENLRLDLSDQLREVIARRGMQRSGLAVLDALLKLRQVCCDPRLLKLDAARKAPESAKLDLLMNMLSSLVAEGRRVLIFSQFTSMLRLIADALQRHHLDHVTLTGDTRDRATPVRRFQDGEVPLFLLSLKAGGVGLNLTAADTVIHYDPWWNPAAEAQASDRAHRIGQDKPVFVYRLITTDTVEERIEAMKARKAELAEAVLSGGGTRERLRLDQDDLDALLAPP